ncbi:hypothetical protein [Sediminimonas qiaohouensis]|uniref:hypothetical protein n=1 Tax=Sediminimonas qiaohouensis TaxID=552061 RepID=UPI00040AA2C1|nr:hypothetical protein [Sediminimonas qiaohouensis]
MGQVSVTILAVAGSGLSDNQQADALPDLADAWAADLPHGQELLDAYMAAVADAGETPLRDWHE